MAAIDDIKSGLDISQVAALLGTDPATADQAVDAALGSLLGAMEGNVAEDQGALSLAQAALGDHSNDLLDGGVDLHAVDAADGEAILSHLYSPQQIQSLSGRSGGLIDKLLPLLAPIVMAYLAQKLNGYISGGAGARQGGTAPQQGGSGGILGDILGSVLGGRAASPAPQTQQPSQEQGSILGDILGSIFGSDAAASDPEPAPAPTRRTQQAPADSPFNQPAGSGGGLRMDDGSGDAPAPSSQQQQGGQQLPSGGLGDLLRQILVGR